MDYTQLGIALPPTTLVVGGPRSGKTTSLVTRAWELVKSGVAAHDILFVVASPTTIEPTRKALPAQIDVCTAHSMALSILKHAGWRHRLICSYEEQLLFEDLRTTSLPQKPLRRIQEFIYASLASLGDWNPAWIEMHEERLVYNTLMDTLNFTGGVVESEAANLACKALLQDSQRHAHFAARYVLADDFDLFNGASQALCGLLATEALHIAGEEGSRAVAYDSHPYGLEGFMQHANITACTTKRAERTGAPTPPEETHIAQTVQDEFASIADMVRAQKAAGTPAGSIAVVGVHPTWRRNIARYLHDAGIEIHTPERILRIRDFADEQAWSHVQDDIAHKLVSNPADGVALRSAIGLGDYLARSVDIKRLREANPHKTLVQIYNEDPSHIQHLIPEALLRDMGAEAGVGEGTRKNAQEDAKRDAAYLEPPAADKTYSEPSAEQREEAHTSFQANSVFVCSPADLFGQHFELVIFGGAVEGWLPARAYFDAVGSRKKNLLDQAKTSIDCARRAADTRLVLSAFEECSLEFAERLGIHYSRIILKDGVRTCKLAPFNPATT